jgi:hypothetical protein
MHQLLASLAEDQILVFYENLLQQQHSQLESLQQLFERRELERELQMVCYAAAKEKAIVLLEAQAIENGEIGATMMLPIPQQQQVADNSTAQPPTTMTTTTQSLVPSGELDAISDDAITKFLCALAGVEYLPVAMHEILSGMSLDQIQEHDQQREMSYLLQQQSFQQAPLENPFPALQPVSANEGASAREEGVLPPVGESSAALQQQLRDIELRVAFDQQQAIHEGGEQQGQSIQSHLLVPLPPISLIDSSSTGALTLEQQQRILQEVQENYPPLLPNLLPPSGVDVASHSSSPLLASALPGDTATQPTPQLSASRDSRRRPAVIARADRGMTEGGKGSVADDEKTAAAATTTQSTTQQPSFSAVPGLKPILKNATPQQVFLIEDEDTDFITELADSITTKTIEKTQDSPLNFSLARELKSSATTTIEGIFMEKTPAPLPPPTNRPAPNNQSTNSNSATTNQKILPARSQVRIEVPTKRTKTTESAPKLVESGPVKIRANPSTKPGAQFLSSLNTPAKTVSTAGTATPKSATEKASTGSRPTPQPKSQSATTTTSKAKIVTPRESATTATTSAPSTTTTTTSSTASTTPPEKTAIMKPDAKRKTTRSLRSTSISTASTEATATTAAIPKSVKSAKGSKASNEKPAADVAAPSTATALPVPDDASEKRPVLDSSAQLSTTPQQPLSEEDALTQRKQEREMKQEREKKRLQEMRNNLKLKVIPLPADGGRVPIAADKTAAPIEPMLGTMPKVASPHLSPSKNSSSSSSSSSTSLSSSTSSTSSSAMPSDRVTGTSKPLSPAHEESASVDLSSNQVKPLPKSKLSGKRERDVSPKRDRSPLPLVTQSKTTTTTSASTTASQKEKRAKRSLSSSSDSLAPSSAADSKSKQEERKQPQGAREEEVKLDKVNKFLVEPLKKIRNEQGISIISSNNNNNAESSSVDEMEAVNPVRKRARSFLKTTEMENAYNSKESEESECHSDLFKLDEDSPNAVKKKARMETSANEQSNNNNNSNDSDNPILVKNAMSSANENDTAMITPPVPDRSMEVVVESNARNTVESSEVILGKVVVPVESQTLRIEPNNTNTATNAVRKPRMDESAIMGIKGMLSKK